jgi:hypothetical protein
LQVLLDVLVLSEEQDVLVLKVLMVAQLIIPVQALLAIQMVLQVRQVELQALT